MFKRAKLFPLKKSFCPNCFAKYQQTRKCDRMTSRTCRGETEDLFLETNNGTGLRWYTDFQHGQENMEKEQRWEEYTCSNM